LKETKGLKSSLREVAGERNKKAENFISVVTASRKRKYEVQESLTTLCREKRSMSFQKRKTEPRTNKRDSPEKEISTWEGGQSLKGDKGRRRSMRATAITLTQRCKMREGTKKQRKNNKEKITTRSTGDTMKYP